METADRRVVARVSLRSPVNVADDNVDAVVFQYRRAVEIATMLNKGFA